MLRLAIQACRKAGKYVGICGQGPSDHLDFAKWLVHEGIESLSLNPDTVVDTWLQLSREADASAKARSEEHTSELQSPDHLVCRLLLEKKKKNKNSDAQLRTHRLFGETKQQPSYPK